MIATLGLAFLAGVLSILSPCVLPLLPIVLGTAGSKSKWGPLSLSAGVVIAFVTVGLFISIIGFSIGLDGRFFRFVAAVALIVIGLVLLVPPLQHRFALLAAPSSSWADERLGRFATEGVLGQFGVGLLLGTVWSPCVGPTLGAASLLASQGKDIGQVALTMVAFAIGVGVPLVAVGVASRSLLQRSRSATMRAAGAIKLALGVLLMGLGLLIVSGFDKHVEAALVDASPQWLTALTTRF